ncbi:MAG: SLC13 family permease [Planctomycetaceae bacterium]
MADTRADAKPFYERFRFSSWRAAILLILSTLLAAGVALLPEYVGLSPAGRWALFILILAASLWITEAIPAFAVGLLVIGLEIAILGRPGGVFATDADDWERFIGVWGSPLIWLFFGGFVLAAAAEKIDLASWLSRYVLRYFGRRPATQLLGCMATTFVFSMFISNTAAAMMMLAMMIPSARRAAPGDGYRKSLPVGIAFAASLGGMATLIGSPPNAIAAGALRSVDPVDFAQWMIAGLPPAALLLSIAWIYLVMRYPSRVAGLDEATLPAEMSPVATSPMWKRVSVVWVFAATVLLWLSSSLHGIPATVVSFIPICSLTMLGVLDAEDIRRIPWDVLLLIAGGLALGVAVTDTGLANWMIEQLPVDRLSAFSLALVLCYATAALSNLMSNTAATNILVPIAIAASTGFEPQTVVPLAISASAAMCLPISTPPNAIAYGTGEIETKDLLQGGLIMGALAPLIATAWCWWVFAK